MAAFLFKNKPACGMCAQTQGTESLKKKKKLDEAKVKLQSSRQTDNILRVRSDNPITKTTEEEKESEGIGRVQRCMTQSSFWVQQDIAQLKTT